MKLKLILIGLVLLFGSACTEEDGTTFGKSDCYFQIKNKLDQLEKDDLDDTMNYRDEDGYRSSYKVCVHKREFTENYLSALHSERLAINYGQYDCILTNEELLELDAEIIERISDLEKALDPEEGVYDCESLFNTN